MTLDGVVLQKYSGKHYSNSPILLNNSFLVTGNKEDNSIHIHNIATGETVYKFFHQSSEGFKCFAYQPRYNTLFATNMNGKIYLLKSLKPVQAANNKLEWYYPDHIKSQQVAVLSDIHRNLMVLETEKYVLELLHM